MFKKVLLIALFASMIMASNLKSRMERRLMNAAQQRDVEPIGSDTRENQIIKFLATELYDLFGRALDNVQVADGWYYITFGDSHGNLVQAGTNAEFGRDGYFVYGWIDTDGEYHGNHIAQYRLDNVLDTIEPVFLPNAGDLIYHKMGHLQP